MKDKVIVKVMSLDGHTELSLTPEEAIEKIKSLYNDEKKWVYLDNDIVNPTRVTKEMLLNAGTILASNAVAGGPIFSTAPEYQDSEEFLTEEITEDTIDNCGTEEDLEVDIHMEFEKINVSDGNASLNITGKVLAVIELIEPNGNPVPSIKAWLDESSFPQIAHLRDFIFDGVKMKIDNYLQGELEKFKKVYNIK